MEITITRTLEFDAAHRVMNHESKCATLHGHRYKVELVATAPSLDSIGRIIDFSVLKDRVGTWIDRFWDHTSILYAEDRSVVAALQDLPKRKPPFIAAWNPTAENMAKHLLEQVCPAMLEGTSVKVVRVRVYETPNCMAEAWLKE